MTALIARRTLTALIAATIFVFALGGRSEGATVTLGWNASSGAAGYILVYGTSSGALSSQINVGNVLQAPVLGLAPSTTYYFAVKAYNAAGTSGLSAQVSTRTRALSTDPATTDFNLDGSPDLLWQKSDGTLAAWLMSGTSMVSSGILNPSGVGDPNWRVAGVGDFNGDGSSDLLWQNRVDGTMSLWYMQGTTYMSSEWLTPTGVADQLWRVAAVADFNGDDRPDLLWQHQTNGTTSVWYMNGARMTGSAWVSQAVVADPSWKIVSAADWDGNGKPDLLWQNRTTGGVSVWYMNGVTMTSSQWIIQSHADPGWRIAGATDLNGDGKTDLVWQHNLDGRLATWLMNGLAQTSSLFMTPNGTPDLTWKVIAVR